MNVFRRLARTALALTALTAAPVNAAELGFYVGFLYGDASKEYDRPQFESLASQLYEFVSHTSETRGSSSTSEDGETYGFLAGYRLSQHLAFEGGYLYLGKQGYRERSSGLYVPEDTAQAPIEEEWSASFTSRTSGFALSVLGVLPISYSWEVYGRAGVLIGSNTLSFYGSNGEYIFADRQNESSTDWLAGAGISYSLLEVYALRAEFMRVFDAGEAVFGEADADVISLGLTVKF